MRKVLFAVAVFTLMASAAFAQTTDTHQVTVTLNGLNDITLTGGDIELVLQKKASGDPDPVTDTTCSLGWNAEAASKITVETDQAAPDYTLKVEATGTITNGTKAVQATLTTTPADLITAIATGAGSCDELTYTASALEADSTGSDVHTVTYTLTAT